MRIKVISPESSAEHRKNVQRQFDRLDIPFDFFDAITPEKARRYIHHYDEKEFFLNSGRHANASEIASYASHLALWKQCGVEGRPFLILEDDANLDESFLSGLRVVEDQIMTLGFIRVSLPAAGTAVDVHRHGPFRIGYCRRVPHLALAYAVSPGVATQLADAAAIIEEPVDKYLQRFWRHGQPVFAVRPPFVHASTHAHESVIPSHSLPKHGLTTWILLAARKAQNSIMRTAYNVSFVHGARRSDGIL